MLELSNSHKPYFASSIYPHLGSFSILLLLLMLIPIASAQVRTISFNEQYQDYLGNWHIYNNENLANYPYYIVSEDGNNYTITRMDDSIRNFSKNNMILNLNPSRISFTFNFTPAQLNSRSVKDGVNWYIPIPKPQIGNRFSWDDMKPDIYNETGINLNNTEFWYEKNGEIRLYYNQTARNFGINSKNIYFEFNSYIINNATTQGYTTQNFSTNGSRFSDNGLLALNLRNDSALNMSGLVAYWSNDETYGVTIHNINNESGLVNITNQGNFIGNASLNWSVGKIGNASEFDGVNDYVFVGYDNSLIKPTKGTVSAWFYQKENKSLTTYDVFAAGYNGANNKFLEVSTDYIYAINADTADYAYWTKPSINMWHHLVVTSNDTKWVVYLDGVQQSLTIGSGANNGRWFGDISSLNIVNIGGLVYLAGLVNKFNGSIDEVHVWNRALNQDEVSVLYNTSLRTKAMPTAMNITATAGNRWNRTRWFFSGQGSTNNASAYAWQNGTATKTLIQSNITSGTWYPISDTITIIDSALLIEGNGSNTIFIEKNELDELPFKANITSWGNNKTNDASLNLAINTGTTVLFNATANQTISNWTVIGCGNVQGNGTLNGNCSQLFAVDGVSYVNISGTNANGTTNWINWTITATTPPTLANIHGWVNNTLGAPVNGVRIDLDGNHTYSSKRRIVNNTNLAPTMEADMPGTGERLSGVTYWANYSDIELFAWAHANQSGQTAEIHLFINGVKVQDISGKPLGAAEENNKSIYAVIPKGANYSLEFLNEHHHMWVEYLVEDGYYDFKNVHTGNYTMTFQQVGYYNFTTTENLVMNSVVNATMIPLTDESGWLEVLDGVDIAWLAFMIGTTAFIIIIKHFKKKRKV